MRRVPLRRRPVKEVNYTIDLIKITQSWAIMDKLTANQCYKEVLVCIKALRAKVKSNDKEKRRIYLRLLKLELALYLRYHCITLTRNSAWGNAVSDTLTCSWCTFIRKRKDKWLYDVFLGVKTRNWFSVWLVALSKQGKWMLSSLDDVACCLYLSGVAAWLHSIHFMKDQSVSAFSTT